MEDRRVLAAAVGETPLELVVETTDLPTAAETAAEAAAWKAAWESEHLSTASRIVGGNEGAEGEQAVADGLGVLVFPEFTGQFTLQRASDQAWLLYPAAETSYLSVNIDGDVYTNDDGGGLIVASNTNDTWVYAPVSGVQITQVLTVEGDAVRCEVIADNVDGVSHSVQVRYLFDTQVDDNDGAPLYNGTQHFTSEAEFDPPAFTEWRSWRRPNDQSVVGVGQLDPSDTTRVVFAHWSYAVDEPWEYDADPDLQFYTPGYTENPESDSCVLVYMDAGTLAPGESNTVTTWYGAGEPAEQDLRSRLIDAMADLVGAIHRYQEAAIQVFAFADADLAKHIADDSSLTNQAIGFGLDLLSGDGARIAGKLATNPSFLAREWIKKHFVKNWQTYTFLANPALSWMPTHLKDWIHDGDVDFDQPPQGIALDIIDYFRHPTRLGGVLTATQDLVTEFASQLPETLTDPALVDTIVGQLGALADNVEAHIPRLGRVNESPVYWNVPGTSFNAEMGPLNPLFLGQISSAPGELANADTLLDVVGTVTTVRRAICVGWTTGGGVIKVIGTLTVAGAPISQGAYWSGVTTCSAASTVNDVVDLAASGYGLWQQFANVGDLQTDVQLVHDFTESVADNILQVLNIGAPYSTDVAVGPLDVPDVSVGFLESFGYANATITVTNFGTANAPLRASLYVYKQRNGRTEELVVPPVANKEGDLMLAPGESRQLEFQFPVAAGTLVSADRYYAQVYVVSSGGIDTKGDEFRACGTSGCFADDLFHRATSGELAAGETHRANAQVNSQAVAAEFTLGYQGSDMDLHLYDSSGRHVGFNYGTGRVDLEIPGATYSGTDSFPETIAVPTSDGTDFDLEVVAVDTHGREDFFVLQTDVMARPATLVTNLPRVDLEGYAGQTIHKGFVVAELGGQEGITGLGLTISDLTSANGDTIPASAVMVNLPAVSIPAGEALDVELDSTIPAIVDGEYTGHIQVDSDQGSVTVPILLNILPLGWQNPYNRFDVNDADGVTPQDVLDLINHINSHPDNWTLPVPAPVPPHPFLDVTNDGICSAQDVLDVINYLNDPSAGAGEGEAASSLVLAASTVAPPGLDRIGNSAAPGFHAGHVGTGATSRTLTASRKIDDRVWATACSAAQENQATQKASALPTVDVPSEDEVDLLFGDPADFFAESSYEVLRGET